MHTKTLKKNFVFLLTNKQVRPVSIQESYKIHFKNIAHENLRINVSLFG